jgi:glycosyltransferase involved in cell wall biosynthesis
MVEKIAIIGLRMYPAKFAGVGGNEVRGEVLINHFLKQHQLTVYVRSWVKPKVNPHKNLRIVSIFTFNNKFLDTFIYSFFASCQEFFSSSQVVFYEGVGSSLFCFLPKLRGKKVVTTFHALEWQRKKWPLLAKLYLKISEIISCIFSDVIVAVTADMASYLKHRYHKKALVIPYFFEKKPFPGANYLKKLGLKKDNYILFLGRIVPEKRVEWLIKAYGQIKTQKKLVIAGGELHDSRYFNNIKNLAKADRRIIFTNYVFGHQKEELLANCSLLVLPSQVEGFALVVMEALAYHRKILIPDFLVYRRLFSSQSLFRVDSYSSFVRRLKKSLNFPNHCQWYLKQPLFTKEEFFQAYARLLYKLLKNA